jgi:glutamate synthase domain-containing protein 3
MLFQELNDRVRRTEGDVEIDNCLGQRFIGAGRSSGRLTINGTPGNALGAYLDGAEIFVNGNAQDAVGDTMNDGLIAIRGSVGDAAGYAMRGGRLYVRGSAGYRTGIHMKAYRDKKPVIIVGGRTGSFLGEYLAGGIIIVLGLDITSKLVSRFTGTGMHGGKIFLRQDTLPDYLPEQVNASIASERDLDEIISPLKEYSELFNLYFSDIINHGFCVLTPNAKNPYKRIYTAN